MTASTVSDDTFEQEVLQSTEPVLVDFTAEWCGPCKAMAPALDQVAKEMQAKVKIVKLDVDNSPAVTAEYRVRAMPTLILFKNGRPVGQHVGALVQKRSLELQIDALLAFAPKATSVEPRTTEFKLANGMEVVVIPDHRAPSVSHMIFYRVGTADAPQGRSGLADLLERLMFKSIETVAVGEFTRVYPSRDVTVYHQRIAKDQLQALMVMEAHRMTGLRLTDVDMSTGRQMLVEDRRLRADFPGLRLHEQMNGALYLSHPYGIPVLGRAHEIANLTCEDVMRFYRRYYAPNNAILVVSGDVTPEEVKRLAEETYAKIPASSEVERRARPQLPSHDAAPHLTLKDKKASHSTFCRTYIVPSYVTANPGEAAALELLAQVLGGRLHRKLVEGKLATGVASNYLGSAADSGDMSIVLFAGHTGDLKAVEEGVDAVFDDIRTNGASEFELERAKKELTPDPGEIYRVDNNEILARRYGTALAIGRPIADIEGWPDAIANVTVEHVQRVAQDYLNERRAVTGWLLPEAEDAQSSQLAEVV